MGCFGEPILELRLSLGAIISELGLGIGNLLAQFGQFGFAMIGHDLDDRSLVPSAGLHSRIGGVIEVGEELVVFFLADGVVFVVVALTALHGEGEPNGGGGHDAVDDVIDAQFFGKSASFVRSGVITIKA